MNESIGARLKRAREQRRLTLLQVSEITKVRPHYLEALENDDLSAISSAAQARGFLRIYAEFLGLNAEELMLVKSPGGSATSPQQIDSPSNLSSTISDETGSEDKVEHPGLLGNLLNRFMRRKEKEPNKLQTVIPAIPAAKAASEGTASPIKTAATPEIPPADESISFHQVRDSEELTVKPVSPVEEPVLDIKAAATEPVLATDPTPTVKAPRKTSSRPRKSSIPNDQQNLVKKKGNE